MPSLHLASRAGLLLVLLVAPAGAHEGATVTLADASGMGNRAEPVGAPKPETGYDAGAWRLDGADDRLHVADAASLDATMAVTLTAWVRPHAFTAGEHVIVEKGGAYRLALTATGSPTMSLTLAGGTTHTATCATVALPPAQWTHLSALYDSAFGARTIRLYVGGTEACNQPVPTVPDMTIASTTQPASVGARPTGADWLNATLDEIRVYTRALTTSELQSIRGGASLPTGNVLWLKLDETPPAPATLPIATITLPNGTLRAPARAWITVEGSEGTKRVTVDFDGDDAPDLDLQDRHATGSHVYTTAGTHVVHVAVYDETGAGTHHQASLVIAPPGPAPSALVYPETGAQGRAPFSRWVVVRGDESVTHIRVDYEGDGTWDHEATARSTTVAHTWPTPGTWRLVVQLEAADGTLGIVEHTLRVENNLITDPLTTPRTCPFCHIGDGARSWNTIDPTFTPAEVFQWLLFVGLVAAAGFIFYVRLTGGTP